MTKLLCHPIRALGKPGGEVTITPEATFDGTTSDLYFYLGSITIERKRGKPKTENITKLFYVDVTITDAAGNVTTYTNTWVFDIDELLEYLWNYDNKGLKLLQVRFYEDPGA